MGKYSKAQLKERYVNFKEKSKNFEFIPPINSPEECEEKYKTKFLIKHLDCQRSFSMTLKEWNILNTTNRSVKDIENGHLCIFCAEERKENLPDVQLIKKYNRFKKQSSKYEFTPIISNLKDYEDNYNLNVTIKHVECGRIFEMTLKEWNCLNSKNRVIKDDDYNHLCVHCAKEKKECLPSSTRISRYNSFKKKSKNFEFEPKIAGIYDYEENHKHEFLIKHKSCGRSFKMTLKDWNSLNVKNRIVRDEENNHLCVHCAEEKKEKAPDWQMRAKYDRFRKMASNFEFVPAISSLEDYQEFCDSDIKVNIKHLGCNELFSMTIREWQNLNVANKILKDEQYSHMCVLCAERKRKTAVSWEWKKKFAKFEDLSKGFRFTPSISNAKEYKDLYESEVEVEHLECKQTFKIVLSKWTNLHAVNRSVIDEKRTHLCVICAQEKKNLNFQIELDKKYDGDFLLKSNFNGDKNPVVLYHESCGQEFEVVPEHYRRISILCKKCGKRDAKFEEEKNKKRNDELSIYLKDNGLVNYIPLSDSKGISKKMMFKHSLCGHVFERTPRDLVKFAGRKECPECIDMRYRSESQEERNAYFQDKLNEVHKNYLLVSDYSGQSSDIKVKHLKCGNIIDVNSETIRKDRYQCPYCESNNLKNSNYISLSEKIRLYEEELDYKYKILTPFVSLGETITVRHEVCGEEFSVTGNTFIKGKKQEICPVCKRKKRLEKALKKLKDIHGDDYVLLNPEDFESTTKPLRFKHVKCNSILDKTFSALWSVKGEFCSECSPSIDTTSKLKSYVFRRFKGEYTVAGEYIKSEIPIAFRHKKCRRLFYMSSKDFQNRKIPCPHCSKESISLGMEKAQEKVDAKFSGLFKLCGNYKNMYKEIPIVCNSCSTVFNDNVATLLKRGGCPECKAKSVK